jgi:hypothetical protein
VRADRNINSEVLDSVRRNLESRFADDDTPELELHPNVVREREFAFEDVDTSVVRANNSSQNNENNNANDNDRLTPTQLDARSEASGSTPSRVSHRGEFSLTSYDSDIFDPTEEDYTPLANKMSQPGRAAQNSVPRDEIHNVPVTPEQVEEKIGSELQ